MAVFTNVYAEQIYDGYLKHLFIDYVLAATISGIAAGLRNSG